MNIPRNGYFTFSGGSTAAFHQITELHCRLIPYGPVPRLGPYFMAHAYYPLLLRAGWMRCDAYALDGKIVGFLISQDPEKSLFRCLGIHGILRIAIAIVFACASSPRRAKAVLELIKRQTADRHRPPRAQLLSFGVHEKHRRVLDVSSGEHISNILFSNCLNYWTRERGLTTFCQVKKDNVPMLLFYKYYDGFFGSCVNDTSSYEVTFPS